MQTEQTPLLDPASSTTLYSTPTPAGGVVVEDDKHYNLVGLTKGSFWILVGPSDASLRDDSDLECLADVYFQCLSMWLCSFLGAFDGTVGK